MFVELYDKLNNAQKIECSRALFKDKFGNPICFIIEPSEGSYWVKDCGDKDFVQALALLGVNCNMVIDRPDEDKKSNGGIVLP